MKLILTIILIIISGGLFGQDSVSLRITKVLTDSRYVHYWMKAIDGTTKGYRYYTKCECTGHTPRKKGDIVRIASKDLIIEGRARYE